MIVELPTSTVLDDDKMMKVLHVMDNDKPYNEKVYPWPDIAVMIPTFNRPRILAKCIERLYIYLDYPGRIAFHIGVDGDYDSVANNHLVFDTGYMDNIVVLHRGPNKGIGANLNMLNDSTNAFVIKMALDDDHILNQTINLAPHVKELVTNSIAGWIRLYWVQGHEYHATLKENYWHVHWDSPFLYIPSFRPHIKHRRFHQFFGDFPTGLKLGETEEAWCHQCRNIAKKQKEDGDWAIPHVLVPLNHVDHPFDHIGSSWQAEGF